ncbi:hypothetical protein HDU67_000947 [Dinochytrium kinnereticum]|nr:hypothetical protein HDU67_000947 [Dinochytrium kinnereticum]
MTTEGEGRYKQSTTAGCLHKKPPKEPLKAKPEEGLYAFSLSPKELKIINRKWAEVLKQNPSHNDNLNKTGGSSSRYGGPAISEPLGERTVLPYVLHKPRPLPDKDSGFESNRVSTSGASHKVVDEKNVDSTIKPSSPPDSLDVSDVKIDTTDNEGKDGDLSTGASSRGLEKSAVSTPGAKRQMKVWLKEAALRVRGVFGGAVRMRGLDGLEGDGGGEEAEEPSVDCERQFIGFKKVKAFFRKLNFRQKRGCA